jgi:hypothetical protein
VDRRVNNALLAAVARLSRLRHLALLSYKCDHVINALIVGQLANVALKCPLIVSLALWLRVKSARQMPQIVATIGAHFPRLKRLSLNAEVVEEEDETTELTSQEFRRLTRLTHLSLSSTNATLVSDHFFAGISRHMPRLQALRVENARRVTDRTLEEVALLPFVDTLEVVLSETNVSQSAIDSFVAKTRKLKTLCVQSN